MNLSQQAMLYACAGGALGGVASYIHLAFQGFKEIPTSAPSLTPEVKAQRIYFLLARIIFSIVCAFIVSFLFMEEFENGALHRSKLIFISALIGFSTTTLGSASRKLAKWLG